jgi:exosortase
MEDRVSIAANLKKPFATIELPVDMASFVRDWLPGVVTAALFVALYFQTAIDLAVDWWTLPEAGHGLLLAPVAIWFAWKSGIRPGAKPNIVLGSALLLLAIAVRCAAGLAADIFSTRVSMMMVIAGLTVYRYGFRQLLHWWLPFVLGGLSIPLPELITQAIALPLQFRASRMGASLLQMRDVPVLLSGNIIRIPGHELFVTEACSGLRSLTALLSVGVLMGAVVLTTLVARVSLLLIAIPIAIAINGVRVFLTGFLVFFVSPSLGEGFMHLTEGWLLFLVSLGSLAIVAAISRWIEVRVQSRLRPAHV